MRLGVIADVHGNDVALRAVLDDAARHHVDRWWVLGDLVLFGPRPAEVLDRLRGLPGVSMLRGNTDRYVLTGEQPAPHATAADAVGRTDLVERYAAMAAGIAARGEDGKFGPFDIAPPANPEVYGMGHALYSTAPDYMRFLRMFLNRGALDGKRLLSESSLEWMLADHMNGLTFRKMTTATPIVTADCDPFPETRRTHSFGHFRIEEDVSGMRSTGSQSWAGVLNTHYWFDIKKDVAAVIMTQSLPFVEPRFMQAYADYERAVYAM